jgi:hypothetical protein
MLRNSLLVLAALTLVACDSNTEPVALEGCYELQLGTWSPPPEQYMAPPTRVELSVVMGNNGLESGRTVVRGANGATNNYRWSWWQADGADVVMVFSTGFTGLRFELTQSGGTLRGRGETFADHPETTAFADITLSRITCTQT